MRHMSSNAINRYRVTGQVSKYGVIVYGASALEPAACYQATRKGVPELSLGNETL